MGILSRIFGNRKPTSESDSEITKEKLSKKKNDQKETEDNIIDQNVQPAYEPIKDDRLIEMLLKWAKDMVWKCPKCNAVLEKKLDPVLNELFGSVSGTNTCNNCETSFLSDDVYGSKYDITIEEFRSISGDKLIDRGVKLIIDIIEDSKRDSNTRIEAIAVVAKIGGKNIIDILKQISKDQNQEVQIAAKKALEKLGKKQEQELHVEKRNKDSDEKIGKEKKKIVKPFELRLRNLASQLGIRFDADGFNTLLPLDKGHSSYDIGVMSLAQLIENSLRYEDINKRRQRLTELTKDIDEWSEILEKNDNRIQILWAMHTVASAIVDGRQVPTEEELGFT